MLQGGCRVRVRERDYDAAGHGGTLWGSAVGLAIYIARHRRLFAGKTVLELGSGLGLCGIACAKAGRPEVCVLTDWGGGGGAGDVPPLNQQYDAKSAADATAAGSEAAGGRGGEGEGGGRGGLT